MRPKTLRVVEGLDSIVDVQRRLAICAAKIISRRSERRAGDFPTPEFSGELRGNGGTFRELRNKVKKTTRRRLSERCAANPLD
jgi:hypothetical protein